MEHTATAARPRSRVDGTFLGVLLCFVLSGFAALLYQTAWMRQFSVVFGTSELAVATVLAAYMAGLAAGAGLATRLVPRVRRPVLVYGLLELGIAGGALLVPLGLRAARALAAMALGGSEDLVAAGGVDQTVFFLVGAFVVVMIPTALMGATLPLLTRHAVRRREQIGPRVGLLYAFNTGGAVLGTLAAAFWLLPTLGLQRTVLVGVATNVIVFALAAALARGADPAALGSAPPLGVPITGEGGIDDRRARWILPLILASGAVSFLYEVLWTRLLAHVLGGSVQAFATMLAAFLTGITLGGALAAAVARGRRSSAFGFVVSQVGIAGLSLYVFLFLDRLPRGIAELGAGEGLGAPWARVAGGALVLLPAAVCIGMTFPFALRVLAREEEQAGPASARVYAWNTVGAIAGALLAGFLLVPELGFSDSLRLAVCLNLSLAVAATLLFLPSWRALTGGLAVALGLAAVFRPGEPERLLAHAVLDPAAEPGRVISTAVGRSATVMLLERPDGRGFELRSNGLPEAAIDAVGVPPFGSGAERWLTLLPVLARPSARNMLVVGFGGGVALEELPPTLVEVDVVELEPEIVAANRLVADRRRVDPLANPALHVVINDARGALELTDRTWDVIVSQPSHPWTAGASHLYTREFLTLCRAHMKDDGVLVQWINAGFLDEALLGSVGATLLDAFPHVRLYRPIPSMLVFLASAAPLEVERDLVATGQPLVGQAQFWNRLGLFGVSDVAMLLAMEQAGLEEMCRESPVITDDANLLAMRAGPELKRGLDTARLWTVLSRGEPLEDEAFLSEVGPHLDRPYMARRMMYTVQNRAIHSTNILTDPREKKLAQGLAKSSWQMGDFGGAAQDLQEALRADPGDPQARFALVRQDLPRIARGDPGTQALAGLAAGLTGSAGAVVVGWRDAVRGDWAALESLEGPLAEAQPVVAWYLESVRLRAMWRLRGSPPRAEEALALVDAALHLEPDPALMGLRLEAALALDRPHHVLHTARALLQFLAPRLGTLPPALEAELVAGLRALGPRLEPLELDERLDGEALRRLRAELGEVLARLPAPADGGSPTQEFR